MNEYLEAALKLHQYIIKKHWDGQAIIGPDPIGKINWRVTRFVKSYTPWLPWWDKLAYLQGQSYWLKANTTLFELTHDPSYLNIISQNADFIINKQLPSGAWEHPPIRERRGFISTLETAWASLGLIAAYQKLNRPVYLETTLKAYDALINFIGFLQVQDSLAIKFYPHGSTVVPNVTTVLLWLLAEIYKLTGDKKYLTHVPEMVHFLRYSQMENGEFQYHYESKPHFQCYQYNSFQFMDLAYHYQITGNEDVRQIINKSAHYLATGVTKRGSCRYNCFKEFPETNYWTAALATALRQAHELGLGDYLALSEQAYHYLLTQQRSDGGFDFSKRTYGFLRDRCSYPRYLAMILKFLLYRAQIDAPVSVKTLNSA